MKEDTEFRSQQICHMNLISISESNDSNEYGIVMLTHCIYQVIRVEKKKEEETERVYTQFHVNQTKGGKGKSRKKMNQMENGIGNLL